MTPRLSWSFLLIVIALAGCGSASSGGFATNGTTSRGVLPQRIDWNSSSGAPIVIRHVVLVIQENRTFDDFFATFPGADGARQGEIKTPSGDKHVLLQRVNLLEKCDFSHSWLAYRRDWDNGKMDAFNLEGRGQCKGHAGKEVYQYVDPKQIAPYWRIASQWVLGDHMFTTQGSDSFTAHQDLIAGGTMLNPHQTKSIVDIPSAKPWGCDAPAGTVTSLLIAQGKGKTPKREYDRGPFPCLTYATLRDLLDAKSVAWKYYSPREPGGTGSLWNAFDAIKAVRKGPEWKTNIAEPKQFFNDVTAGTLPSVAWIVPDAVNSDHPGNNSDTGPSWVASIVNAIGESSYWRSTAVIVVWDDWGGFYDNVPPPFMDKWGGLGFRVPMLIVSPYARKTGSRAGYISHTQYEFGSILKFIEAVWRLGSLGTTDTRATSIVDCFDFTQSPRAFTRIKAKYSRAYFLRQPPSGLRVDSE